MSESFITNQEYLLSLLPSFPKKDEMEAILRITPQGISKINADVVRGISSSVIINDLTNAMNLLKQYNSKFDIFYQPNLTIPVDYELSIEEKEALIWAKDFGKKYDRTVHDPKDFVIETLNEYRTKKITEETQKYCYYYGSKLNSSCLCPTSFTPTVEYITKNYVGLQKNILSANINPIFLWFDLNIKLEPKHFRKEEWTNSSRDGFVISFPTSDSLCVANLTLQPKLRKVSFADLPADDDQCQLSESEDSNTDTSSPAISPTMSCKNIDLSSTKKRGIRTQMLMFFDKFKPRRPSFTLKNAW